MSFMYRAKWCVCVLLLCFLITGCGEQKNTSEVLLYQDDSVDSEGEQYKTVTVKKSTYKETVSGNGKLFYTTKNNVSIDDENAYLDKLCVKNGQKVKKGDVLAIYHLQNSKASLRKKKLLLDKAKSEYEAQLKSKQSEVLAKKKSLATITGQSEINLAKIELKRLQNEYKSLVNSGRDVRQQEKDYNTLVRKQKKAYLKSDFSGTAVKVTTVNEWQGTAVSGEKIMMIRDESDFLVQVNTENGGLRYNMTVNINLGPSPDKIKYRLKGRVISTDNLYSGGGDEEGEQTTLIKLSEKDMKKYSFEKYNIYVKGVTLRIKNALLVDADAVYGEAENEDVKLFVYLLEDGKLHKRYIVSNYRQPKYFLVNQGVEEGQTLAVVSNQKGEVK